MDKTFSTIKTLKQLPYGVFRIESIYNNQPFSLVLLTRDSIRNNDIIGKLSKWRKRHEVWFPDQFPVSDKRTKRWLQKKVIDIRDRLLFMVHTDGKDIGHIGLFRFNVAQHACEIDNIVRGEDGFPGIMGQAVQLMIGWGRTIFGIKTYRLQTTSDNQRALRLYKRLGFKENRRLPLVYRKTSDGGQWIDASDDCTEKIIRHKVFMSLLYVKTK